MLKHGIINALNIFGLRELDHCPPHFEKVHFTLSTSEKDIRDWIYENLQGRFCLIDCFVMTATNTLDLNKMVGFEIASEASYFSLCLDKFNKFKQ